MMGRFRHQLDSLQNRRAQARARHAWLLRYAGELPLAAVGRAMGVSRERARQLIAKEQRRQDIWLFNNPYEFYLP